MQDRNTTLLCIILASSVDRLFLFEKRMNTHFLSFDSRHLVGEDATGAIAHFSDPLAVERGNHGDKGGIRLRGIFSTTQIVRQLGMNIQSGNVANTFAEIEAQLSR